MRHEPIPSPDEPAGAPRLTRRAFVAGGLAVGVAGPAHAQTAPAPPAPQQPLSLIPPTLPIPAAPAPEAPSAGPAPASLAERPLSFALDEGRCEGLLVAGPGGGRVPGLLLVPELAGLGPQHVRLAHRLAGLGYLVLVPNFITVFGSAEDRNARNRMANLSPARTAQFLRAALAQLAAQPACSGALGIVALGWGGGGLATVAADPGAVKSIVVVHTALPPELLHAVKVPLQLHYAGHDDKMQAQIDPIERRLIGHSRVYEQFAYEEAGPGFVNELDEKRYNEKAASALLGRMEFFLARTLRGR